MKTSSNRDQPWLIVRLGEDFNWWVAETPDGEPGPAAECGILDPRQVADLVQRLAAYEVHGYRPELFREAFQFFELAGDLGGGTVRLVATHADALADDAPALFALPRRGTDDDGPYYDLLDAISAAHIRLINATHHYAQDCTEAEMFEELDARDTDRYFAAMALHAYDEIAEILDWSPAE